MSKLPEEVKVLRAELSSLRRRYEQRIETTFGTGVLKKIQELQEELRLLKEENGVLREQVRYWKWEAVSWGAPDYENFESKI